jgi:hypothetical protein
MSFRLAVLAACLILTGCGETTPTATQPQSHGAKAAPLPPEVEFDPATAAAKYQAAQKKHKK